MTDPTLLLSSNTPSNFPEILRDTPTWLLWKPLWSPEKQKFLKLPLHSAWQKQRVLFQNLPSPVPSGHGFGIIYSTDHPFICIDVDNGSEENAQLVELLDSYTEWSPSGNGAHVIVSTDDKLSLVTVFGTTSHNNVDKRDLYISSGYVTITGNLIAPYAHKGIKHLSPLALTTILTPYFKPVTRAPDLTLLPSATSNSDSASNATQSRKWIPNQGQVQAVLAALPVKYLTPDSFKTFTPLDLTDPDPPESREAWLTVGQALHSLDNGNLMHCEMWKDWSKQGDKYDEHALYACWRSFNASVENAITFATLQKLATAQRPQFSIFSGNPPKPMCVAENIRIYIEYIGAELRYNRVNSIFEVLCPPRLCRAFKHEIGKPMSVDLALLLFESALKELGLKDSTLHRMIKTHITERMPYTVYSPIVEHFTDTMPTWDHHSRIPELMATIECAPADVPIYTRYIRAWLIQVMAAVFTTDERPNRLNNVLILQGDQGVGKTMWVESLFPPGLRSYCIGSKSVNMSQFRNDMVKLTMELTNTLICNINEIDTVFNPKTYSEFKAFLDSTTDKVVLPYGHTPVSLLRSTVFIGSTNKAQLFTDTTGNRRFMLINAESFNFKHGIDINQLWAEACYYYHQGERWYFTDEDKDIKARQTYDNMQALNIGDETIIDLLNNTFDPTQPVPLWSWYTFPRIRTLLGLKVSPNSNEFRTAKYTIAQWLTAVCHPQKPQIKEPKHKGTAWQCLMPPIRD